MRCFELEVCTTVTCSLHFSDRVWNGDGRL